MRDDSTALPEVPNEPRLPRAPGQHDLAVEMRHLRRARPLVQVVDVLGDDPDFVGPLEVHQGPMGGIGLGRPVRPPPLVVELQHEPWIRRPGFGYHPSETAAVTTISTLQDFPSPTCTMARTGGWSAGTHASHR